MSNSISRVYTHHDVVNKVVEESRTRVNVDAVHNRVSETKVLSALVQDSTHQVRTYDGLVAKAHSMELVGALANGDGLVIADDA